jgi:hypothetical protein
MAEDFSMSVGHFRFRTRKVGVPGPLLASLGLIASIIEQLPEEQLPASSAG